MKFNKTRMYKVGSHTPKKGVVPLLPLEEVTIGTDEAPVPDFAVPKTQKNKKKKKK